MQFRRQAFLLAGATASGKSAVAAILARGMGAAVLNADSMLVYRGMDVGTAKPPPEEIEEFSMGGVDLVTPEEPFSAGAWLRAAAVWAQGVAAERPIVVVGGTGLYFAALLRGLDGKWTDPPPEYPVLLMDRARRRARIAERIGKMAAGGLEDEVRSLKARYPRWSRTAAAAIGYKEFFEAPTRDAALELVFVRTCRLAKRQDTWFRHQARALWIPVADTAEETAGRVAEAWRAHGPWEVVFDAP